MSCEKSSSSYTTQIQLQDPNIKIYKDVITLNINDLTTGVTQLKIFICISYNTS